MTYELVEAHADGGQLPGGVVADLGALGHVVGLIQVQQHLCS